MCLKNVCVLLLLMMRNKSQSLHITGAAGFVANRNTAEDSSKQFESRKITCPPGKAQVEYTLCHTRRLHSGLAPCIQFLPCLSFVVPTG